MDVADPQRPLETDMNSAAERPRGPSGEDWTQGEVQVPIEGSVWPSFRGEPRVSHAQVVLPDRFLTIDIAIWTNKGWSSRPVAVERRTIAVPDDAGADLVRRVVDAAKWAVEG